MRELRKRRTRTVKVLVELEVTRQDGKPILDGDVLELVRRLLTASVVLKPIGWQVIETGERV